MRRFLAEAPDAFAERMQKLQPFLLTVQQGQGVPFLLPVLLQVVPQASEEQGTATQAWLAALLDKQVTSGKPNATQEPLSIFID